ncbi:MAG: hypothetical protein WBA35_11705 [Litorimonas sp.]
MRAWLFTVAVLSLGFSVVLFGVFGESARSLSILILIFAGPYVVFQLLLWLIRIGWRAKYGEPIMEPRAKLTKRETRTKLVKQWTRDQIEGGPLKGTPRPLTLDEEKAASGSPERDQTTSHVIG